jgi:pSer/pThr/pTyr-binding forkhead associated (FHA) protein
MFLDVCKSFRRDAAGGIFNNQFQFLYGSWIVLVYAFFKRKTQKRSKDVKSGNTENATFVNGEQIKGHLSGTILNGAFCIIN